MLLLFTNPYLACTLLTLWYVNFNSKRNVNLIFIFIFINGALNSWLKFIFKIPLHESLNNQCWYSFPSGHMQYGLVFWGILWIHAGYNLKFLAGILLFLLASGWSMNQHNYHTAVEMIGAIPPAATILGVYNFTLKRIHLSKNNLLWLNLTSIVIQLTTLGLIESPCENYKFGWMWLNIGVNLGFGIISLITTDKVEDFVQKLKLWLKSPLIYCICLIAVVELWGMYKLTNIYKTELGNVVCGIFLPIVLFLTSKLYQKFNTTNG